MSIRSEKSRHEPGDKGSRLKRFGLLVLAILLLQEVKRVTSVPEHALGADSPQVILNQTASFSVPRDISRNNGHDISRSHSEIRVQRQQIKQFFTDSDFQDTNTLTVVKGEKKVLDSGRPSSSRLPSHGISSWDSKRHSSKIDTDLFNLSHPVNSTTSLQSSSVIAVNKIRSPEDLSTPSKAKRLNNNKVQSELKLLSENSNLFPNYHDYEGKDANDATETYNQSRKKKRKKYFSWMNAAKHYSHKRSHRRKVGRKLVDSDKVKSKEKELTINKRSIKPSGNYPKFRGAGKERILLRFKREEDQKEMPRDRKKRKRKKREKASQRHAKLRSLPRQNVPNGQISGLTKGYWRSVVWRKPALGRDTNGFVTAIGAIPQVKYEQQVNRLQSSYVAPNSDRFSPRPDQYVWRKSLPAMNVQEAQKGQVSLATIPYSMKKSAWPETFQSIGSVEHAQFEQPVKSQYVTNQPQPSLNTNVISRKQAIQHPLYAVEPRFSISQMALPDRNHQIARLAQIGPVTPQLFPQQGATTNNWSPVLPEGKSHVIQADDVLKGSPELQGLIMYLNFEDAESGKAPYTSFYGNVAEAGKRTEISRSFGSCGKVVRINNGSEILLNAGKIKVKPRRAISIAAWIKLDTNKGRHSIFDTVGSHSLHQKGQYHFEIQDGSVRWFHRNESDNTIFSVETAPIIPANVWNHVVGTYDAHSGIAKVFVNGRLKAEAAGKGVLSQDWDAHAGIGKHKGSRFLQGNVDEFRIYNKALTQKEIQNLTKICSFERACGGFFYSPTGVIESPEWPNHYKGKTLCTWRVVVDSSDKIALRFNTFALEEDGTCSKAKLVVRDGNSDNANVLGVYCGNKVPPDLTSSGNRLWLQFTSTEGAEGKGFLLHYDTASFRQTKKTERPPTPFDGTQRCAVTKPEYNVTLIGGIKSGIFSEVKRVHDMDLCTRHCCLRKFCDLAFMIRDTCYLVKCANPLLCKTKKARPSSMNPRISFVSHLSAVTPEPELSADGSAYSKAADQSKTTPSALEVSADESAYSKTPIQGTTTLSFPEVSTQGSAYSKATGAQFVTGPTAPDLSADGNAYSKTSAQGKTTPSTPEVSTQGSAYSKATGAQFVTGPTAPDLSADGNAYSKTSAQGKTTPSTPEVSTQGSAYSKATGAQFVTGSTAPDLSADGSAYSKTSAQGTTTPSTPEVSTQGSAYSKATGAQSTTGSTASDLSADGSAFSKPFATSDVTSSPSPPSVEPVCHHTAVSYNVTLVGGINAGKFSTYGGARNMDECIRHCCHDDTCDVAFMIQGNCYAVECADTGGCQIKRAKPSAYHPTVAFVYRGSGRPIGDPLPGAEKPSLDACSKLTVSNTIYNVTLRGGIKAGNFTDKGVVKNMKECSAFCCADERCNVAFLIRDNCFLVACKDYDSCKMKPALSEYYRPRIAFVNWSPPDDEIPANRWYASLGCWKDTESFAVSSLEGSDPLLQGSFVRRDKPIDTCAQVARKHNYKVFAIQNGGACLGGPTAGRMFNQFGESSACKEGKGGLFVNDVYRLTFSGSYVSLGCWNDSGSHALPLLEHFDPRLDDYYQTRSDPLQKCGQVARKRGYTVFAVQRGGMCFGGPFAEIHYRKYGISRRCHDGLGGAYANSVYRLIDNLETTPMLPITGSSTSSSAFTEIPSSTTSNDFSPATQYSSQATSSSPTTRIQENYLTLQDGVPLRNTYTAGDILYNVTLKYGIKAGKFSDKGKVGNMSDCIKACGKMETCSLAFMLGKQCFAVSCYNDALCLTKPAYSPFYKPQIAFVKHSKEIVTANASKGALSDFSQCRTSLVHNDVTLVGGINAGKFTDLGDAENMTMCSQRCCFKDACDVAFMLEGECYGVKCINESLCETRPARNPERYNPKIVYVYHNKKKDKAPNEPKLKALIKMIDRLLKSLTDKPQEPSTKNSTPTKNIDVKSADVSVGSDEGINFKNDLSLQTKLQVNDKQPNSRTIDENFSTDIFTPTTPPVRYEKLVGKMMGDRLNVYALPFLFNGDEVEGRRFKSFLTSLPSESSNNLQGFYVQTPKNLNLALKSHDIVHRMFPVRHLPIRDSQRPGGFSPGETLHTNTYAQQNDLMRDKDLQRLLLEWRRENTNKHNREWRDDEEGEALASYYDTTDNDLLSLSTTDLNRFSKYLKLRLSHSQGSHNPQDVFTNRFPFRAQKYPQRISQGINSFWGVSSAASSQQKSVCWDGQVLHNYTLVGGINAGTFTDNGKASNMDICMQFCCKRETCDLAFMIEDDCYSVACNSNGACEPRKARPTHYLPRIAIRKKPQGNSNVKVPLSTAPTSSTVTASPFPSSSPTPATSLPTTTHATPVTHQADASVKVTHSCDATPIEYNVTLKMGLHSGEFQKIGKVESMDDCIEMSCRQSNSDVAFMLGSICFAVHCYSADLCKTVPIFGSSISRLNLNPAISFLRKKSRFRTNSLAVQNDGIYQDKCRDSTITYNVTLRGGIDAGNFTERAGTLTMRDCIGKCCNDNTCDLAFMFGDSCYSVECRNEKLCQAVLAKPSRLEPKISYITRGYFDDKDKGTMFSASDQTPTCRADQKSRSSVVSNKTLVGGLEAGKFTFVGVVSDMNMCMDRCCAQRSCNVAYMVDNNCFSVSCFSPTLCKISDVPSANGDVKISTIMNSTAERPSEKNSMIVYVIIGVVGFAAGAGGILWAVCMFIRRHRLRSRHRQDTE